MKGPSGWQSVKESGSKGMGWINQDWDRDEDKWLDFVRKLGRASSIKLLDWRQV